MSTRAIAPSKLAPQASRAPATRPATMQPLRVAQPSRANAPQEARIVAPGGSGNPLAGGMGIPAPGLGEDQSFAKDNPTRNFSGSSATRDFLRVNTIREADLKPVDITGMTLFNRKVGVHVIPLQAYSDALSAARDGAFVIGQGQSLIVTKFQPFASVPNIGLPGANTEIDPVALIGQVSFHLTAQGGPMPFNMQTITSGNGASNGMSILSPLVGDQHPSITATIKTGSVGAVYEVTNPPFPGFPRVVGVRIRGYLIDALLLNAIMDTVTAGNENKLNKDVE